MKNNKMFKRIISAALCLCMMVSLASAMLTVNAEITVNTTPIEGRVPVVKVIKEVEAGTKITAEHVALSYMKEEQIHINAITSLDEVVGKYATTNLYVNECVFRAKLAASVSKDDNKSEVSTIYTLVTEHGVDNTGATDVSSALTRLINSSAGKTLQFPDGVYLLNSPIVIPTDDNKAVSFNLAQGAVIKAGSAYSSAGAMIQIGKSGGGNTIGNMVSFQGGIIDASGKATALSVASGKNVFVTSLLIRNAKVGMNVSASYADIENVNITGAYNDQSTGLVVSGNLNTFSNMHITGCKVGVEVSGDNNMVRGVNVVYNGSSNDSAGFYDKAAAAKGNYYDGCTAENYASGFKMNGTCVSQYSLCGIFWNKAKVTQKYAFHAEGQLKSVIRGSRSVGASKFVQSSGVAGGQEVLYSNVIA